MYKIDLFVGHGAIISQCCRRSFHELLNCPWIRLSDYISAQLRACFIYPVYTSSLYISTWIFEDDTPQSRPLCLQSRQIKIYEYSQSFFSPLLSSLPFSFRFRVVWRLTEVKKTWFEDRSGKNGQIFRIHLFKNPARYRFKRQWNIEVIS